MSEFIFEMYVDQTLVQGKFLSNITDPENIMDRINTVLNEQLTENTVSLTLDTESEGSSITPPNLSQSTLAIAYEGTANVEITRGANHQVLNAVTLSELADYLKTDANAVNFALDFNRRPLSRAMDGSSQRHLGIYPAAFNEVIMLEFTGFSDPFSLVTNTYPANYTHDENESLKLTVKLWLSTNYISELEEGGPESGPFPGGGEVTQATYRFVVKDSSKQKKVYMPSFNDGRRGITVRARYGDLVSINDLIPFSIMADFPNLVSKGGYQSSVERPLTWVVPEVSGIEEISVNSLGSGQSYTGTLDPNLVATSPSKAAQGYLLRSDELTLVRFTTAHSYESDIRVLPVASLMDVSGDEYGNRVYAKKIDNEWQVANDTRDISSDHENFDVLVQPDSPVLIAIEANEDYQAANYDFYLHVHPWSAFINAAPAINVGETVVISEVMDINDWMYTDRGDGFGVWLRKVVITEPTRLFARGLNMQQDYYFSGLSIHKEELSLNGNYNRGMWPGEANVWFRDSSYGPNGNGGRLWMRDIIEPGTYYIRIEAMNYYTPIFNGYVTLKTIASLKQSYASTLNGNVLSYTPDTVEAGLPTSAYGPPYYQGADDGSNGLVTVIPWGYRRLDTVLSEPVILNGGQYASMALFTLDTNPVFVYSGSNSYAEPKAIDKTVQGGSYTQGSVGLQARYDGTRYQLRYSNGWVYVEVLAADSHNVNYQVTAFQMSQAPYVWLYVQADVTIESMGQ